MVNIESGGRRNAIENKNGGRENTGIPATDLPAIVETGTGIEDGTRTGTEEKTRTGTEKEKETSEGAVMTAGESTIDTLRRKCLLDLQHHGFFGARLFFVLV